MLMKDVCMFKIKHALEAVVQKTPCSKTWNCVGKRRDENNMDPDVSVVAGKEYCREAGAGGVGYLCWSDIHGGVLSQSCSCKSLLI